MSARQNPKKSETLEIRLSHEAKAAFMARRRQDGRTASEVLRGYIEAELAAAPPRRVSVPRPWRLTVGALALAAVAAAAAPSLARPSASAEFQRLDANHDGVLSLDELQRLDVNHDGRISFSEYRGLR